ncbi:MAG: hypothetical protein HYR58_01745 [Acidobacteria bacterium]|nr:hypothetical protein [Acidobacteriota bacterium]
MRLTNRAETEWKAARQEFAERYYRWAIKDARRETEEDFPFVRRVRNQTVYGFLEMIEPMEMNERLRLMTALVKRSHNLGLGRLAETMTPEDESLVQRYWEYDHGEIIPGIRARLPIMRDGKHKRMRMEGERFKLAKIDRRVLHRAIIERLRGVCGPKLGKHGSRSSSSFESTVGSWTLTTEFSTGSKFWHFDYFHRLLTPGGLIVGLGMSLEHWLGMGGSQTYWELEDESQVERAVDALCGVCAHFLREAAIFLEGFEPPKKL